MGPPHWVTQPPWYPRPKEKHSGKQRLPREEMERTFPLQLAHSLNCFLCPEAGRAIWIPRGTHPHHVAKCSPFTPRQRRAPVAPFLQQQQLPAFPSGAHPAKSSSPACSVPNKRQNPASARDGKFTHSLCSLDTHHANPLIVWPHDARGTPGGPVCRMVGLSRRDWGEKGMDPVPLSLSLASFPLSALTLPFPPSF